MSDERQRDDVLEVLYGGARADALSAEARAELEGFGQVRALYRALPTDEPPSALTAQLLAAAARHAPAREPGWLRRLFLPLMLHPGLAAAASLVLVAGLVGTMVLHGKGEVARPSAPSQAPAPRAADGESATAPRPIPAAPRAEPTTATFATAPDAPRPTAPGGGAPSEQTKAVAKPDASPQLGRLRVVHGHASDKGLIGEPLGTIDARDQADGRGDAVAGGGGQLEHQQPSVRREAKAEGGEAKAAADEDMQAAAGAAPPPPPDAPVASATTASVGNGRKNAERAVQDLHKDAIAAAGRRECGTVLALGRKVQAQDPSYYRDQFRPDAQLKLCFESKAGGAYRAKPRK